METDIRCPVCNSTSVPVASLFECTLLKCTNCHWLFTQSPIKMERKEYPGEEKRNEYLAIVQKSTMFVDMQPGQGDKVLDVSSGDGTLLGWYLKSVVTVGVESDAALMKEALNNQRVDVPIMEEFYTAKLDKYKFKIITIVDVFQDYDIMPLLDTCRDLLTSDGVIVTQGPYFPQLLEEKKFTISKNYLLTFSLRSMFQKVGLELQGIEFPKKGIRCYATFPNNKKFATTDYDSKLRLYTAMSAAIMSELHARYDLESTYSAIERKFNPKPLGAARNVV